MKLIGKDGKEYEVQYAYAPTMSGRCVIQLQDNRSFAEIAEEFEGVENFHLYNPGAGEFDYTGYTEITYMNRNATGVNIQLVKG